MANKQRNTTHAPLPGLLHGGPSAKGRRAPPRSCLAGLRPERASLARSESIAIGPDAGDAGGDGHVDDVLHQFDVVKSSKGGRFNRKFDLTPATKDGKKYLRMYLPRGSVRVGSNRHG